MIRRFLNVIIAGTGLVVSLPILIIFYVLIRLETPGNPIFSQTRLGWREREFTCFKLRTMFQETPDAASHLTSSAQVTRIGKLMRKTKIDELPQLWNVVKGEMDLVGPRPGLPNQLELTAARRQENVFSVRPGITGLGQVQGVDMSTPEKLAKIDRTYIEQRSLAQDLRICWATIAGKGYGDRTS